MGAAHLVVVRPTGQHLLAKLFPALVQSPLKRLPKSQESSLKDKQTSTLLAHPLARLADVLCG
jgi:hypothetical protein